MQKWQSNQRSHVTRGERQPAQKWATKTQQKNLENFSAKND
jgi:hypothetical protein